MADIHQQLEDVRRKIQEVETKETEALAKGDTSYAAALVAQLTSLQNKENILIQLRHNQGGAAQRFTRRSLMRPGRLTGFMSLSVKKLQSFISKSTREAAVASQSSLWTQPQKKTWQMSRVSSTAANNLLNKLSLEWVDGNALHEILLPPDAPIVPEFGKMHEFACERAATRPFADYLKDSFEAGGVVMGKDNLDVQCVHTQRGNLKFETDTDSFTGYLDIVVLPFGSKSYVSQMRLGVELKQNQGDKQKFRDNQPSSSANRHSLDSSSSRKRREFAEPLSSVIEEVEQLDDDEGVDSKFSFAANLKGQATLELLSAYAYAQFPVDIVVTDGHKYHILRLRGRTVICWEDLTTAQAMHHMASFLKEANVSVDLEVAADEGRVKEDKGIQALLSMRRYRPSAAQAIAEQVEQCLELSEPGREIENLLETFRTQRIDVSEVLTVPESVKGKICHRM